MNAPQTIGTMLRQAREEQGLDLSSIATYLRIRLPYLQSIENDALAELPPGDAYRIGFIKSYAAALDLDVDQAVALFRKDGSEVQKPPLRVRVPIQDSQASPLALIAIVVSLLAIGAIAWLYLHHSDRVVANDVPPVPERLQVKPVEPAVAAVAVPPAPADTGEPDEARDEAYNHPATAQVAGPRPEAAASPPAAAGHALNEVTAVSRVAITASADSWVQVKDNGKAVYTGVMHQGDIYKIPDQPGWTMTAGNAGGVTLAVDGKAGAPLGAAGAVVRDVPLDAVTVAGSH